MQDFKIAFKKVTITPQNFGYDVNVQVIKF